MLHVKSDNVEGLLLRVKNAILHIFAVNRSIKRNKNDEYIIKMGIIFCLLRATVVELRT